MRAFSVHERGTAADGRLTLVPEQFFFWGALLGPFGWLFTSAWALFLPNAVLLAALPVEAWPSVAILVGLCGHDAERILLGWRGWRVQGVVLGTSYDHAELRWRRAMTWRGPAG